MRLIFKALRLIGAAEITSALHRLLIYRYTLYLVGHKFPIKKKFLRKSFSSDLAYLMYQVVSEHIQIILTEMAVETLRLPFMKEWHNGFYGTPTQKGHIAENAIK